MKIIFLKDSTSSNGTVCFSGKKIVFAGCFMLLILPVIVGLGGYWISAQIDRSLNPFVDSEYRIAVESRVQEQEQQIVKTRDYVRKHMDVLGSEIGRLQAQVLRINALGMRLADASGVDLADFHFNDDPPVGGANTADSDSEQVDLEKAIDAIESELALRESELAAVDFLISRNNLQAQQTPAGWPVENGWVSSSFGSRLHPLTGKKQFHRGVDIPGKVGSQVRSVADGVVIRSEQGVNYGWLVEIDHGDGYQTLYSHNSSNLVAVGETVSKGQAIGLVGSSGRSTGPHVHFEVTHQNRELNPVKYLYKKG